MVSYNASAVKIYKCVNLKIRKFQMDLFALTKVTLFTNLEIYLY
jgi:hypothetical protein